MQQTLSDESERPRNECSIALSVSIEAGLSDSGNGCANPENSFGRTKVSKQTVRSLRCSRKQSPVGVGLSCSVNTQQRAARLCYKLIGEARVQMTIPTRLVVNADHK
jgi:hypothetical protein